MSKTIRQSPAFGVLSIVGIVIAFILVLGVVTDETYGNLIQYTLNGIFVGGVYSLVALGIVIINKASGIFNFAHGIMMLFGGLMFWETFHDVPSTDLTIILAAFAGITVTNVLSNDPDAVISDKNFIQRWIATFSKPLFLRSLAIGIVVAGVVAYLLQLKDFDTARRVLGAVSVLAGAGLIYSGVSGAMKMEISGESRNDWLRRVVLNALVIIGFVLLLIGLILFFADIRDEILRGALGGMIGSLSLGLLVERFAIRPLLGQPTLASIMMTLAVAILLQGVISLIWGPQPKSLPVFVEIVESKPSLVPVGVDEAGNTIFAEIPGAQIPPRALPNYELQTKDLIGKNLSLSRNLVWGFVIGIICFSIFVLFFQFTSTGLSMRAVAEDQTLAETVGLRVRTILAIAWAIATTMAMIAAVIQGTGPAVGLGILVIPPLAFRAFPAVLLGGLESITGALVGGLIIGIVETLTTGLVNSTTGQEFAPFAVLLIVLIIRPDGLFGQRRIDRV